MFKKILIGSLVLAASSSIALAGAPYVGIGFGEQTNTNATSNFRGVPAQLFAGYGADMGQGLYLGGELLVTVVTAPISNNGLKSTYNYGLSILPGIMISDHTMTYARLGLTRTHFTANSGVTVTGAAAGLGIQTSLTQNWDLRGEYTFIAHRSLGGGQGSPRSDIATLGLVYRFA